MISVFDVERRGESAVADGSNIGLTPSDRQYRRPVIEYRPVQSPGVIEYPKDPAHDLSMTLKSALLAALTALTVLTGPAHAACYADYKAKRDNPLKLHYGVIKIPDRACDRRAAASVITQRIRSDGWTLLNVLGVFGDEGLSERQGSAGQFFLRY